MILSDENGKRVEWFCCQLFCYSIILSVFPCALCLLVSNGLREATDLGMSSVDFRLSNAVYGIMGAGVHILQFVLAAIDIMC